MTKKHLLGAVIFIISAVLILGFSLIYSNHIQETNVRGKYMFADTRDKINYLGNVKIITPESGEINIHRLKDGSWRFKEANDYYVNEDMLAVFFNMIKNSIIVTVYPFSDELKQKNGLSADKATQIKTFDYNGKLLDDVVLGTRLAETDLFVALKGKNESYAYGISSVNSFSGDAQAWIPYPLLNIKPEDVKEVTINGKKTDYQQFNSLRGHSMVWRDFANALDFLDYYGLTYKSDLSELPPDTKIRQIDVLMLTGMYYKLTLFEIEGSYWVVISMDVKKVFMAEAINVAAERYRYYSDWVFRLSDEQGSVLFDDRLLD